MICRDVEGSIWFRLPGFELSRIGRVITRQGPNVRMRNSNTVPSKNADGCLSIYK